MNYRHSPENRHPDPAAVQHGRDTAKHLETAVKGNDLEGYNRAMKEVTDFRDNHKNPSEYRDYLKAATQQLERDKMLPQVSLFEAGRSFANMDKGFGPTGKRDQPSGSGRLDRDKVNDYKGDNDLATNLARRGAKLAGAERGGTSPQDIAAKLGQADQQRGQRDADWLFAKDSKGNRPILDSIQGKTADQIKDRLKLDQSLSPKARTGLEWAAEHIGNGGNLADLEKAHGAMKHLDAKGENGQPSLRDRLMNKDGGIDGGKLRELLNDPKTSERDKSTIQHLQSQAGIKDAFSGKDLTAEHMREIERGAGWAGGDRHDARSDQMEKAHLRTLFDRNPDGKTLYGRLKEDYRGHIPAGAIDKMLENDHSLKPAQKAALEFLKEQRSNSIPNMFQGRDLSAAEVLRMGEKHGLVVH